MAGVLKPSASSEPHTKENKVFRFEDLPDELQVRIIEFAVIEDKPIKITGLGGWGGGDFDALPEDWDEEEENPPSEHRTQPNITKVNKKIRVEALKAYYGLNKFSATYSGYVDFRDDMLAWLEAIGPENRAKIRSLVIADCHVVLDKEEEEEEEGENPNWKGLLEDPRWLALEAITTRPGPEDWFNEVPVTFPKHEPSSSRAKGVSAGTQT